MITLAVQIIYDQHYIERAVGFYRAYTVDPRDEFQQLFSSAVKHLDHRRNFFFGRVQRLDGGVLGDRTSVGGGVALERIDRLGNVFGCGEVSHAPACHGIGLGNAVDGDCQILHFIAAFCDGEGFYAVVAQLFIDFVRQHENFRFLADFCNCADLFFAVNRARRVGRGIEDQHFRLGCDRCF